MVEHVSSVLREDTLSDNPFVRSDILRDKFPVVPPSDMTLCLPTWKCFLSSDSDSAFLLEGIHNGFSLVDLYLKAELQKLPFSIYDKMMLELIQVLVVEVKQKLCRYSSKNVSNYSLQLIQVLEVWQTNKLFLIEVHLIQVLEVRSTNKLS